jgi:hypothetical protein
VPGNLAITSNLNVGGGITTTGAINAGGDLNAGTAKYNTRVGGIWSAPGIYAENGKNLEIGAGSGNVYIGSASGNANQNLIVTGSKLTVAGRDILAELDKLNSRWEGNKLKAGEITTTGSIVASGGIQAYGGIRNFVAGGICWEQSGTYKCL